MKKARMLLVLALMVGAGQAASGQVASGQELSDRQKEQLRRDQLHIAVQEICPISEERLGSMGQPLKVRVGKETVFLCCQGCLN